MTELSAWKKVGAMLLLCAATIGAKAQTFTDFHDFDGIDGAYPTSPGVLAQGQDGNLYGTTAWASSSDSMGMVFKTTLSGALTVLYNFDGVHGTEPQGGVTLGTDGNFYGTTTMGGGSGGGTIFKITPTGHLTTLYSLYGGPIAAPILGGDGNFYGTAYYSPGFAYEITPSGTYTLLAPLPYFPYAPLFYGPNGNFYGTTYAGGSGESCFEGCGTNFHKAIGQYPVSQLTQHTNGKLYGMTSSGGAFDYGVVYSVDLGLPPFAGLVSTAGKIGETGGILGQGFTGATSVSLNGSPANFTVMSDTFIEATIPPGATTGYVTVTTPSGTLTSNVPFRVIK